MKSRREKITGKPSRCISFGTTYPISSIRKLTGTNSMTDISENYAVARNSPEKHVDGNMIVDGERKNFRFLCKLLELLVSARN